MKSLILYSYKTLAALSLFLLFCIQTIQAQEYNIPPLNGTAITNGATMNLIDPLCDDPDCDMLMTTCAYQSYIELGVGPLEDPSIIYASGTYNLEVSIVVDYIDNDINEPPVIGESHTLSVQFNKEGGVFKNKDRVILEGGYDILITIMSVTYTDPAGNTSTINIPNAAYLQPGIITGRFDPIDPTVNNSTINYPTANFENFIDLDWTAIPGADFYDLEWTWVDSELNNQDIDEVNFKFNSSRINTENTAYRISNIYQTGKLIARVRGIGRLDDCETFIPTIWNLPDLVEDYLDLPVGEILSLDGHREGFNWQHSRTYAEEGKHKDVISYFDGSLRSRQTVSRIESDGHAVVAESYYDHVGRPVVQAIPAPFILGSNYAQNIDYYDNFNTSNGVPYNREHFEKEDPSCLSISDAMDDSGSGQYYSPSNTITDDHQAYLPDAKGYPFSQTILTQDQTGRVRFQGGVGDVHTLGAGKETQYYYGIPEQQELDRLFGNDVGYKAYYEKNLVVDANGQVSVSYLDNKNRVIATALAGTSPLQLDALASQSDPLNTFNILSNLSDLNTPENEGTIGTTLTINKQVLVSENNTSYTFDYTLTPQDYNDEECAPSACFDCAYELKLVVYDECGDIVMGSETPISIPIDMTNIDDDCEDNGIYTLSLNDNLDIGSYGLNKKLSLDPTIMNTYEELYIEAYECAESIVEIFNQLIMDADLEGCVDAACLGLCTVEIDIQEYTNDLDAYKEALINCIKDKIEAGDCTQNQIGDISQCEIFHQTLLDDMSPFGQYGTVTNANNEIQRSGLPCTSFYAESNIFGLSYDDISYGTIMVEINGVDLSPAALNLSQFVANYEESWGEFFLDQHPEYVYLDWCEVVNATSETFDGNLLDYDAEEAESAGYLNPLGHNANTIGYTIGGATGTIVAGAHVSGMNQTAIDAMKDEMINFALYNEGVNPDLYYSIWDIAYIGALSNILDVSQIIDENTPAPGMWDDLYGAELCRSNRFWEVFRGLYASLKMKHGIDFIPTNTNPCAACMGESVDCCGCGNWEDIQQRHFGYDDLIGQGGTDLNGGLDIEEILMGGVTLGEIELEQGPILDEHCNTICASYRSAWQEQLIECFGGDENSPELQTLLDEMELVCQSGCDATHPLGASSNADGSLSFQLAIQNALGTTPMSATCNDLLITHPAPYDTDVFGGTQAFIDDCVCDRYDHEFEQYSIGQSNPDFEGFVTYLESTYNTYYDPDALLDLDCACRNIESIYLLDNPTGTFEIPEPFACQACIDCDQASDLYDEFINNSGYNFFDPITSETLGNPEFRSVMTNWFNQELNFNLSFDEYIDFFAYCTIDLNGGGNFQGENTNLMTLPGDNLVLMNNRLLRRDDPEYIGMIGRMVNDDLTFELKANQTTTQAGGTVTYEVTITNNGTTAITFDYYDQLPGGWSFIAYPTNLNGGTLNTTNADIMSVSSVTLNAEETLIWDVTTLVTEQAYIARNYYHQAIITEANDTTYSDNPATLENTDPTGVYLDIDNPCLGPVEEAEDLVAFLNEIIAEVGTTPNYPLIIPVESLSSFGANSSLNLWPHLDIDNLDIHIYDPVITNNEITLMFVNDCGITDILCALTLEGITALSDIAMINDASSLGTNTNNGNYLIQLNLTTSTGVETSITASSSCYSLIPCDQRLLCNRSITLEVEIADNCLDYIFDLLALQATTEHEALINEARERFRLGYSLQCMSDKDELIQSSTSTEYHHTLYYYDQSGSLVRTIPPKGVKVLEGSNLDQVDVYRQDGTGNSVFPPHELPTYYQYNSYGQIIIQDSPDATEAKMYYDRLGRSIVSQNGRQRNLITYPNPRHSYTIYDEQSRIIELGEIIHPPGNPMTDEIAADPILFSTWLSLGIERVQVVKSIYDENLENVTESVDIDAFFDAPRRYLRKRISSTLFFESIPTNGPTLAYDHASHYDYDVHGNVKTLIQEFASLRNINQDIKRIDYDYDLVSGNVHQVSYQAGAPDAFYHRYIYDSDNRLTHVSTSQDGWIWDMDATYEYYDHGPLARTELGEYKVQGCDYVYTIHGWIKGVNSNTLIETRDIGKDGESGGIHELIAADAYGYSLGYYTDDYSPIGSSADDWLAAEPSLSDKDLFNGNIRSMVTAIKKPDGSTLEITPNVYTYDQLHRIKAMQKYTAIDEANNTWATANMIDGYKTTYEYDANGNLMDLTRRNSSVLMDDLTYHYSTGTNQLAYVNDFVPGTTVDGDLDKQLVGNYTYDDAGNLIKDVSEEIFNIEWNVYGKVKQTTRDAGVDLNEKPNVSYQYDAAGNRIIKRVEKGVNATDWTYTYYVRDASGNVMAVYKGKDETTANSMQMEDLFEKEFHLYGSSRLGIKRSDMPDEDLETATVTPGIMNRFSGNRSYELSNHLGNVLAAVSDNKLLAYQGNTLPLYKAEVLSYNDYYPFGLEMQERTASVEGYRYGFNGKENDANGEFGSQLIQDYGFRMYNPSIGKFLSVDPLTQSYPELTPYQFASNTPIWAIDLDGLEAYYSTEGKFLEKYGESTEVRITSAKTFYDIHYTHLGDRNAQAKALRDPKKSQEVYTDRDQAALDFVFKHNGKTHSKKVEFGIKIYSQDTEGGDGSVSKLYLWGKVVEGGKDSEGEYVNLEKSTLRFKGWELAATAHTHTEGDNAENFSAYDNGEKSFLRVLGDKGLSDKMGVDFYLGTPNGVLKLWDPKAKAEAIIFEGAPRYNPPWGIRKEFKPSTGTGFDEDGNSAPIYNYPTPDLNKEKEKKGNG